MKKYFLLTSLFVLILSVFGCSSSDNTQNNAETSDENRSGIELMGAGASFPFPLYSKMFDQYYDIKDIKVNYNSIGSGGGQNLLTEKTVDFAASDAPMKDENIEMAEADIVHIPTCLGAVVVTYNLPNNQTLKLTPEVIADIFLGKITKWNNDEISDINPDADLPDLDIVVVHRSDGSGTTYIFSDYLSKVSSTWSSTVGTGKALDWPVGLGGKGNEGVAGQVKSLPGAIGYTGFIYALNNNMLIAKIKNKNGNFIEP